LLLEPEKKKEKKSQPAAATAKRKKRTGTPAVVKIPQGTNTNNRIYILQ
jgi:hypothetical protein